MKTTESHCSEHFSLFLALALTSALCMLERHFSLPLADEPTTVQATVVHRLSVALWPSLDWSGQ